MLNYLFRKGHAYLKKKFLFNFIKNMQKKHFCRLQNLFLTPILSLDIVREWIPSKNIFSTHTGIRTYALPMSLPTSYDATHKTTDYLVNECT